tara:strand:+ start:408 stop:1058 length:651 start_codon:yes stop_codon:yes gene_type:complete
MAIDLGTASQAFQGATSGITFGLKVGASFGVFAVFAFVIWKLFLEYNIRVTLLKPIGKDSFNWVSETAKIMIDKSDNTRQLVLFRTKQGRSRITTEVPTYEFKGKKGKKDHYMFILDDNFMLQPVKTLSATDMNHAALKLFPEDKRWWARKEDKRRLDKYQKQDFLQKYLPSIVVITAFIITFFIAYFGFTHIGGGMERLAGEFGQVSASCINLGQ